MRNKPNSLNDLQTAGFSYEDACALRRIAMTLHRWHELECGDDNGHASFCISRGKTVRPPKAANGVALPTAFEYDDNGKPFLEIHPNRGDAKTHYRPIPDRERGALRRLAAIMARYPGFASYVQTDPRGASLYIVARDRIPAGASLDSCYSNGIAVFK